jgi:hypothetical protein
MHRHRSHGPEVHHAEKILPPAWHLGQGTEQITVLPRLASLSVPRASDCDVFSGEGNHWASSHECAGQLSKSRKSSGFSPAARRPMSAARSALRHPPPPLESRCPTPPRAPPHCAVAAMRVREPSGYSARSARHRRLSPLPLVSLPLTARTPTSMLHDERLEKGRGGHVGTNSSTCASSSSLTPRTSSQTGVTASQINPCKPIVLGSVASSCHSEPTEAELQAAEEAICAEAAAEMVDSVLPLSEVGNHNDFMGSTCEEVKDEMHSKRPEEKQGVTISMSLLVPNEDDDSDSDMDMVAGVRAAGRVRQNANFAATISFIVGQHFHAAAPNKEVDGKEATEAVGGQQKHVLAGQRAHQSCCLEEGQVSQCLLAETCAATAAVPTRVIAESCGECSADPTSIRPSPRPTACNRPLLAEAFQRWLTCRNLCQERDGSVRLSMASQDGLENARIWADADGSMDLQSGAGENEVFATPGGTSFQAHQYAGLMLSRAIDSGSHASTCLSPSSAACTSRPQTGCPGNGSTNEPAWTDADRSNGPGLGELQITRAGHQAESTKLIASRCVLSEVSHGEPLPLGVARPISAASSGMKTPLLR